MFGTNGFKVEFADFKASVIPPPVGSEQSTDPAAGGEGSGDDEEEEMDADEPEEEITSEAEPDPSTLCKTKPTCLDRVAWCTQTFASDVPTDCTENFGE